eukprot:Gb_36740 [translate_table: standard]
MHCMLKTMMMGRFLKREIEDQCMQPLATLKAMKTMLGEEGSQSQVIAIRYRCKGSFGSLLAPFHGGPSLVMYHFLSSKESALDSSNHSKEVERKESHARFRQWFKRGNPFEEDAINGHDFKLKVVEGTSSVGCRFMDIKVEYATSRSKYDEISEIWYRQWLEKHFPKRMQWLSREDGSRVHDDSTVETDCSIDGETYFFPQTMFPSNCVPDNPVPAQSIGSAENTKIEFFGILDNLPHELIHSSILIERFGIRSEYNENPQALIKSLQAKASKSLRVVGTGIKECEAILKFNGAAKNNPSREGAGGWIHNLNRDSVTLYAQGLRNQTNNVAEFEALILGLKLAQGEGIKRILIMGDPNIVINQSWMSGEEKVMESEGPDQALESLEGKEEAPHIPKHRSKWETHHLAKEMVNSLEDRLAEASLPQPPFVKEVVCGPVKKGDGLAKEAVAATPGAEPALC